MVFSVYLIHNNGLINQKFISGKFKFLASYNPFIMVVSVISVAAMIFAVCLCIDVVRKFLFDVFKVKEKSVQLENRLGLYINQKSRGKYNGIK